MKGSGFHMDIVVISMVNAMCGLFGAPWQCVATVRSVSHVSALTVMSTTHAPGDKPHIVKVKGIRRPYLITFDLPKKNLFSGFLCVISRTKTLHSKNAQNNG